MHDIARGGPWIANVVVRGVRRVVLSALPRTPRNAKLEQKRPKGAQTPAHAIVNYRRPRDRGDDRRSPNGIRPGARLDARRQAVPPFACERPDGTGETSGRCGRGGPA